ncbi:beta-glucosidase [Catenulispora sp. EB89]|uniref:beta-glucosidase family protein n=1 Tax=Catenulispora sp. EB89 TaxID=3156257 RepID=UPI003511005E
METTLDELLGRLTLEQKVGLLTGKDFWSLAPIPEIGLRELKLSDGPNGIRGTAWDERETSLLFPNPTALAATWDPAQARRAGSLMGAQARDLGIGWHLAPNVNLHRSPLGGRHFECYSEDPVLTAEITAGFVDGVQEQGVASTVKHYIGNESETDRMSYDARISDKTLREVYLPPFEAAAHTGAWSVMAAYNSVDGASMTDNRPLLTGLLKDELGFDGVIVSDWTAARSTEASANAGLDVVMPGPMGPWGDALVAAVRAGKVAESVIDDKVIRVLRLAARTGHLEAFDADFPAVGSGAGSGAGSGSDSGSGATAATPDDAEAQIRDLAARAMVVLRNEGGLLPLDPAALARIAVIGPNAGLLTAQGGGSAHVNPRHVVSPLTGITEAFGPGTVVDFAPGVLTQRLLPQLTDATSRDPETGAPGLRVEYLSADGTVLGSEIRHVSRLVFMGTLPSGTASVRVRVNVLISEPGRHRFSVSGAGSFTLKVGDIASLSIALGGEDGDPIVALVKPPERRIEAELAAGTTALELTASVDSAFGLAIFGLHHEPPRPTDDELFAAAVAAARAADVAVVCVGTTDEVESEGFDRTDLKLPGRQDALVAAVLAANPRTVVVVNAGAPVEMPWRDEAAAILWAWFPGQEGGHAVADALTGAVEPGGRLPTTFPATAADAPVLSTTPVDGTIDYAEGALFGYRGYRAAGTVPAYPFGHGLGYTTWEYQDATVAVNETDCLVDVQVRLRNSGGRAGREVVQVYLADEDGLPPRLVGFGHVGAEAGRTATALVEIPRRILARWDEAASAWTVAPGVRSLLIGRSASDVRLTEEVTLRGGYVGPRSAASAMNVTNSAIPAITATKEHSE